MGLTLNDGYGGGSGSYPTLEVTIADSSATSVTATLGSTVVNLAYDSAASVWRGTLKAFGTWAITATDGSTTDSDTIAITSVAVYELTLSLWSAPLVVFNSSKPDVSKWVSSATYTSVMTAPNVYAVLIAPEPVTLSDYGNYTNQLYILVDGSTNNSNKPLEEGLVFFGENLDLTNISTLHIEVTANSPDCSGNVYYGFGIANSIPTTNGVSGIGEQTNLINYGTTQHGDLPYTGDITLDVSSVSSGYLWIGGIRDTRGNYIQIYIDKIWGE